NNLASAEVFDPAGTFAPTGSTAVTRVHASLTRLDDGRVLVTGGTEDRTAEIFDPVSGTFTKVGTMTAVRNNVSTATLLGDGTVLITGGLLEGGEVPTSSAEIYYP